MELKDIQSLVKLVSNSSVDELQIEKEQFRLKIKKNPAASCSRPKCSGSSCSCCTNRTVVRQRLLLRHLQKPKVPRLSTKGRRSFKFDRS